VARGPVPEVTALASAAGGQAPIAAIASAGCCRPPREAGTPLEAGSEGVGGGLAGITPADAHLVTPKAPR
jgi:hypothetical protein